MMFTYLLWLGIALLDTLPKRRVFAMDDHLRYVDYDSYRLAEDELVSTTLDAAPDPPTTAAAMPIFDGGWLTLQGGTLAPDTYVLPTLPSPHSTTALKCPDEPNWMDHGVYCGRSGVTVYYYMLCRPVDPSTGMVAFWGKTIQVKAYCPKRYRCVAHITEDTLPPKRHWVWTMDESLKPAVDCIDPKLLPKRIRHDGKRGRGRKRPREQDKDRTDETQPDGSTAIATTSRPRSRKKKLPVRRPRVRNANTRGTSGATNQQGTSEVARQQQRDQMINASHDLPPFEQDQSPSANPSHSDLRPEAVDISLELGDEWLFLPAILPEFDVDFRPSYGSVDSAHDLAWSRYSTFGSTSGSKHGE